MAKYRSVFPMVFITVSIVILYLLYVHMSQPMIYKPSLEIGISEARARRFGLIIDVRTPKERELEGYYPNSIPIPLDELSSQVPMDISNKNTWILVYSNGDSRAPAAAKILFKMGYKNVRYITKSYLSLLPGSSY